MRIGIIGAGAVGALLGAMLHRADNDVRLLARGENLAVIRERGVHLMTPTMNEHVGVKVVSSIEELGLRDGDICVLAVKSQDTLSVLRDVAALVPHGVGIACAQNGVENERVALRLFRDVYAMCVLTPATHLEPGLVVVHYEPHPGVFDLGRWPGGLDERAVRLADTINAAGCDSLATEDIASLKWAKLLSNIHNATEALVGELTGESRIVPLAYQEAVAVLEAHGIDVERARAAFQPRAALNHYGEVNGAVRGGGSSWQSLARGRGDIETDFLNGEIVLLGRLHSVPTPVNELLQRRARDAARAGRAPGSISEDELLGELGL